MKKLSVLLALLLCCVLNFALPVVTHAAPLKEAGQTLSAVVDDVSCALIAGEVSPGDTEGVQQLDKALLGRLLRTLLQQTYPLNAGSPAVPAFCSFSRVHHLHAIFTQGP